MTNLNHLGVSCIAEYNILTLPRGPIWFGAGFYINFYINNASRGLKSGTRLDSERDLLLSKNSDLNSVTKVHKMADVLKCGTEGIWTV